MTILRSDIKICADGSVERDCDGIAEHKHTGYDYWHPVARLHSGNIIPTSRNIDPTQNAWDVDEDGVYDIIKVMTGRQAGHVDIFGEYVKLPLVCEIAGLPGETLSAEWCVALSKRFDLEVMMTIRSGKLSEVIISSGSGDVRFQFGYAHFEQGAMLHNAKLLLETGIVSMYFKYPDLADAMHALHVSGGGSYYDLIRLPNGGHIPPEILVDEYGVSWETLAKIPLGKPRDCETFTCPGCGMKSFFAGYCYDCRHNDLYDFCEGCDGCDDNNIPCEGFILATKAFESHERKIREADDDRIKRKEFEHGAILRMIKSGNFSRCRYMRGGD